VDFVELIAQSFGVAMGMSAIVLVVFLVGSVFYIRAKVKGKVFAYILAANKQLSGFLCTPQGYTLKLGAGDKEVKFIIHPNKQFWCFWPPGFPKIVQEPIPTYMYSEGNAEPLDPYDRKVIISEESLLRLSDESMLKMTWKDTKESLGIKGKPLNVKTLITVIVLVAAVGVGLYIAAGRGLFG